MRERDFRALCQDFAHSGPTLELFENNRFDIGHKSELKQGSSDDQGQTDEGKGNTDHLSKTSPVGSPYNSESYHTDPEPDADVDIYLDRKRIRRIDNWCVGQHVTLVGRSGKRYDVVLRDITDSSETIRVSVRRAR